jgi:hypothetical protein
LLLLRCHSTPVAPLNSLVKEVVVADGTAVEDTTVDVPVPAPAPFCVMPVLLQEVNKAAVIKPSTIAFFMVITFNDTIRLPF